MRNYPLTDLNAIEIIDNRGMPTIRTYACVDHRFWGRADVPCGSSTGSYEAFDLRDGEQRFFGKGVRKAIKNVEERIWPLLEGIDVTRQEDIDIRMIELDGTRNKSKLGANAILGVSLAVSQAAAGACGQPLFKYLNTDAHILPVPQACLINGGMHAGNDLDVQEFCIMPVGAADFKDAVRILSETFKHLKDLLAQELGKQAINCSEDGGLAPPLSSTDTAMDYLCAAVENAGYTDQVVYALDFAASAYYDSRAKIYDFDGKRKDRVEMMTFIEELLDHYPKIVSIEDPLHEDDLDGMRLLTHKLKDRLVIGDDMFATNRQRLEKGIQSGAGNAILCKVNQVGSLTEFMQVAGFARDNGYAVVMSERSGETEDSIQSDIGVALNAGTFKTGGLQGSDRGAKYNRFIEIEAELGPEAVYAGQDFKR